MSRTRTVLLRSCTLFLRTCTALLRSCTVLLRNCTAFLGTCAAFLGSGTLFLRKGAALARKGPFPPGRVAIFENKCRFLEKVAGRGIGPANSATMIKAITDFSGYAGAALLPAAQTIHDRLAANPAIFTDPPVDPEALALILLSYEQALAKKSSRATEDFIAFEAVRATLEGALGEDGAYVNIIAKGDPVIVGKSGYPSYETKTTPDYSAPGAPANVVVRQGTVSGSFVCRFRPVRRRMPNEVWTCTGDPNVESNWKLTGIFSRGKANLTNFEPGATVWARVRTIGLNGINGAWSDPAKIMVV